MNNTCAYRQCSNSLKEKRPHAMYCSTNCRNKEEYARKKQIDLELMRDGGPCYARKMEQGGSVSSSISMAQGKTQAQITQNIQQLIDEKGATATNYTAEELHFIRLYEGYGGLAKQGETKREVLDQFFTPNPIVEKMWQLAYQYGFEEAKKNLILEPACGTGRFLEYVNPDRHTVHGYEIDKYSCIISQLTFPKFTFFNTSFETLFFKGKQRLGMAAVSQRYDLVIGNPPYRDYASPLKNITGFDGSTEATETGAHTFDQYFIMRGVDVLKPGGLLIYIIPNTFLSNGNAYNGFKEKLAAKCDLVDAYRLPNGMFPNTEVGTDIIVLKRK